MDHGDSSLETIPSRSPRSNSVAMPGKRNGEAWNVPSGENSMLPPIPAFGWPSMNATRRVERVLLHDRVGVQQQHVLRRIIDSSAGPITALLPPVNPRLG